MEFIKLILVLAVLLALNSCKTIEKESETVEVKQNYSGDKPNIIFLLTDDMGYGELGSYGQEVIKTPFLDSLAREGMRFTDFYSGTSVCSPSRASLMTGLHIGH